MRMRNLALGIIERTTLLGAGYGVLLGAVYGALSFPIVGLLRGGPFEDIQFGFVGACFFMLGGLAIGGAMGLACGLAVGLASGVTLALVTILALDSLVRSGRYFYMAIGLCLSVVAGSLILLSAWFFPPYKEPLYWLLFVGMPALLSAVVFWRIGSGVARWVERNSTSIVIGVRG